MEAVGASEKETEETEEEELEEKKLLIQLDSKSVAAIVSIGHSA